MRQRPATPVLHCIAGLPGCLPVLFGLAAQPPCLLTTVLPACPPLTHLSTCLPWPQQASRVSAPACSSRAGCAAHQALHWRRHRRAALPPPLPPVAVPLASPPAQCTQQRLGPSHCLPARPPVWLTATQFSTIFPAKLPAAVLCPPAVYCLPCTACSGGRRRHHLYCSHHVAAQLARGGALPPPRHAGGWVGGSVEGVGRRVVEHPTTTLQQHPPRPLLPYRHAPS